MRRLFRLFLLGTIVLTPSVMADEPQKTKKDSSPAPALTDQDLDAMWKDLTRADDDGTKKAWQHICRMVQQPARAVPFLKAHLQPVPAPDLQRIDGWIADLNSSEFAVREKANTELEKLGPLAGPALKQKLAGQLPSLEVRRRLERLVERVENNTLSGDELRALRAMEVLEAIASPEAKTVIAALAKGAPGAKLTEDAKRAQGRLARETVSQSP